jgi:hypothetical protein
MWVKLKIYPADFMGTKIQPKMAISAVELILT